MTDATLNLAATPAYEGTNRLILGIVLAVVTFWLFAQTTLNVAPTMRDDLHITNSASNIAVSITALFSGIFIVVVAGGLADQFGRVRLPLRMGVGQDGRYCVCARVCPSVISAAPRAHTSLIWSQRSGFGIASGFAPGVPDASMIVQSIAPISYFS